MLKNTVYRCQTQTPISNFHISIPKVETLQTNQQIEALIQLGNFSLFISIFHMHNLMSLNMCNQNYLVMNNSEIHYFMSIFFCPVL